MKKAKVTEQTARMLKELGCFELYAPDGIIDVDDNKNVTVISKPFVVDAWLWFQQNTPFRIELVYDELLDEYTSQYYYDGHLICFESESYTNFDEAVSECLDYIATNGYYENLTIKE